MSDDFIWGGEETVIPEQLEIAVHLNPKDNIVIRQPRGEHEDGDNAIVIQKHYIPSLIAALRRLA